MNKCNSCHLCCEYLLITLSEVPDDIAEFFTVWGTEVLKMDDSTVLKIYSPCRHLIRKGCAIYKDRPQFCRDYECERIQKV